MIQAETDVLGTRVAAAADVSRMSYEVAVEELAPAISSREKVSEYIESITGTCDDGFRMRVWLGLTGLSGSAALAKWLIVMVVLPLPQAQ